MSKVPKKLWRDAATVIVAARNANHLPIQRKQQQQQQVQDDYSLLMLQRHSKSKFMPEAYVFPGGVIDKADYCEEWIDIFNAHGHSRQDILHISKDRESRPPMFARYQSMKIIPDLAFRICAVREAFEECGLMLFRPDSSKNAVSISHNEALVWRNKVHADAYAFLDLCRQYNIVPDIWSLYEWSNWLTPVTNKIRFDTMFYMCMIDHQPYIEHDEKEMTHATWTSPKHLLRDHMDNKLLLALPQLYEMGRLTQFDSLQELSEFSIKREGKGTERLLPFLLTLSNGILIVLPGDDIYTTDREALLQSMSHRNSSEVGKPPRECDLRLEDFQDVTNFNRMEFRSNSDFKLVCNQERKGHKSMNLLSDVFLKDMSSLSRL